MSAQSSSIRPGRVILASLLALWLLGALLAAAGVSWNRAFQVDEVEHLHAGYHLAAGRVLYSEVWQPHNPLLYSLLGMITTVDEPQASYRAGRLMMLLLWLGTVTASAWAAYRWARQKGSALASWAGVLTAGLILGHTTMVERGLEVRPDGLLAFCIAMALAAELSPGLPDRWRHSISGVFLGLGFLATQKAVFACFAFGCLWLARAVRRRCPGRVLWPMIAWAAPLLIAVLVMTRLGNFDAYLQQNILDALDTVSGAEHRSPFSPMRFVVQEGLRNLMFCLLSVLALAVGLWQLIRGPWMSTPKAQAGSGSASPGAVSEPISNRVAAGPFPLLLGLWSLVTLWANPFPWPYVHVTVVPVLAVSAAVFTLQWLEKRSWSAPAAVLLILSAGSLTAAPRLLEKALPVAGPGGRQHQLEQLLEIQRITDSDDHFFDLAGMYFRPDGYRHYALSGDLFGWYKAGGLPPIPEALDNNQNVGVVFNYRTRWLDSERAFIRDHYVHHWRNIYILGRNLSGAPADRDIPFRVLKTKPFRYLGPGTLTVDGEPFSEGVLERGDHTLRLDQSPAAAKLVLATPEPDPEPQPPSGLFINFD